ncbi:MAG: hypothetical protein ACOCYE_10660, partial [Pseudomonadota bacterium]
MTDDLVDGAGPSRCCRHTGGEGLGPRPRISAKLEHDSVLWLSKGEPIGLVSREPVVTAADRSDWREVFLAAGESSSKIRPADDHDAEIARLKGPRASS